MLDIVDGRGKKETVTKNKNRASIKEYFTKNPGNTMTECARVLGLNLVTVSRHVKALQSGGEK